MSHLEAFKLFKTKIVDRAEEVDGDNEHEWETLAYGFFLALDFNPEEAFDMALRSEDEASRL